MILALEHSKLLPHVSFAPSAGGNTLPFLHDSCSGLRPPMESNLPHFWKRLVLPRNSDKVQCWGFKQTKRK